MRVFGRRPLTQSPVTLAGISVVTDERVHPGEIRQILRDGTTADGECLHGVALTTHCELCWPLAWRNP